MSRLVRRVAPVGLVVAGACFATQSDVRVLQTDVQTLRSERQRQDSIMQSRFEELMASLRTTNDSVRSLSNRLTRLQGDVRGDLFQMNQQLLQIQELSGQSQRRLQELRSSLEARQQEVAPVPAAVTPGAAPSAAPTGQPSGPPAGSPGPNQLFQSSFDQLQRGSPASARRGFEELLRLHPTSDVAGDAQFYLAESFAAEGNASAADTAYATVLSKYPESRRAPTALYKRALLLQQRGNIAQARTALNEIVRRYPRSDEAQLARDRLRTMQ